MPELADRVGEVVEAKTTGFTAQCYELYLSPPLGSLVRTGNIYGIVHSAGTSSLEPGRRALARGKDEADEEGVFRANPQLEKLFRSEFECLAVGYRDGERLCQYLPPAPARIHAFVYMCRPDEVKEFSRSLDFLNLLINCDLEVPADELVAAALRQMGRAQDDPHKFLVVAGKELAVLLGGRYGELRALLGRLK